MRTTIISALKIVTSLTLVILFWTIFSRDNDNSSVATVLVLSLIWLWSSILALGNLKQRQKSLAILQLVIIAIGLIVLIGVCAYLVFGSPNQTIKSGVLLAMIAICFIQIFLSALARRLARSKNEQL